MDQEQVYGLLEEKFLKYKELAAVPVRDCGEKMISLSGSSIDFLALDDRVERATGAEIYVRSGLIPQLAEAQKALFERSAGVRLQVFYGYRSLRIQTANFESYKAQVLRSRGPGLAEEDVKELVHHFIAVPEVAGHPTGGAVDVRLIDEQGQALDMGTPAHSFEKDSYTFSPFIPRQAWRNRQLLRECMTAAGFAPFDGEWWHFSYGDREWAAYYKKEAALYTQLDFVPSVAQTG